MYDTDLVEVDTEFNNFDVVWQEVKTLSKAQKAELVKRLLGKESGLLLVSTSSHLVDYIIAQMSLLSSKGLTHVLVHGFRVLANRMACEGKISKK